MERRGFREREWRVGRDVKITGEVAIETLRYRSDPSPAPRARRHLRKLARRRRERRQPERGGWQRPESCGGERGVSRGARATDVAWAGAARALAERTVASGRPAAGLPGSGGPLRASSLFSLSKVPLLRNSGTNILEGATALTPKM